MSVLCDYTGTQIEIEATEVADGAITRDKLSPSLKNLFATPEMFGAVGDGVANDTTAVQTAINQGGIILLNGIYRCTSTIYINKSNTTIDGVGTIIGDFTTNGPVLSLSSTSSTLKDHVHINNITIRSSQTGTHTGIFVYHEITSGEVYNDVIINGVKVLDVTKNGILLHGGPYNSSFLRPRIKVMNCRVINATEVGICQSRVISTIEGNYVKDSGLENLTVDNGCQGVVVSDNTFITSHGGVGGIGVDEADRVVIANNHIESRLQSADNTEYNSGIGCQCNTGPVTGLIVSGNTFVNGKYGIKLGNTSSGYKAGGVFTDNIFQSVGTSQFYLKNASETIRENNLDIA